LYWQLLSRTFPMIPSSLHHTVHRLLSNTPAFSIPLLSPHVYRQFPWYGRLLEDLDSFTLNLNIVSLAGRTTQMSNVWT
jgi:hypothetical protein